jgi:ParB family protein of integrating conjugative element (PFGI_1 class)
MARTRVDVRAGLQESHFGPSRDLHPADPVQTQLLVVALDQIRPYEGNPRTADNAAFERIRESIRAAGLDNPIPITRRPGDRYFTVAAGGNTRLKALESLHREALKAGDATAAARFAQVPCHFKPWVSDIEVLAAHLRENDLREGLLFIDHARAVLLLKSLLEREIGVEYSYRQWEAKLRELGHWISRRDLKRMEYAVLRLEPVIPQALKAGLGPRWIDRIHGLDKAYKSYWDRLPVETARSPFDPLFLDALNLCDGEVLDLDAVRTELDLRLAALAGTTSNRVHVAVDGLLSGASAPSATPSASPEALEPPIPEADEALSPRVSESAGPPEREPWGVPDEPPAASPLERQETTPDGPVALPSAEASSPAPEATEPSPEEVGEAHSPRDPEPTGRPEFVESFPEPKREPVLIVGNDPPASPIPSPSRALPEWSPSSERESGAQTFRAASERSPEQSESEPATDPLYLAALALAQAAGIPDWIRPGDPAGFTVQVPPTGAAEAQAWWGRLLATLASPAPTPFTEALSQRLFGLIRTLVAQTQDLGDATDPKQFSKPESPLDFHEPEFERHS